MKKKLLSIFIILVTMFVMSVFVPLNHSNATQSQGENFWTFNRTGNFANDIATCAEAQVDRNEDSLGYTEGWCANFVSDCARLAGAESVIPFNGLVYNLYQAVIDAGGYEINVPERGDLVFYYCEIEQSFKHVGIMTSPTTTTEGNMGKLTPENIRDSVVKNSEPDYFMDDCCHGVYYGEITPIYVRPNYASLPSRTCYYRRSTNRISNKC